MARVTRTEGKNSIGDKIGRGIKGAMEGVNFADKLQRSKAAQGQMQAQSDSMKQKAKHDKFNMEGKALNTYISIMAKASTMDPDQQKVYLETQNPGLQNLADMGNFQHDQKIKNLAAYTTAFGRAKGAIDTLTVRAQRGDLTTTEATRLGQNMIDNVMQGQEAAITGRVQTMIAAATKSEQEQFNKDNKLDAVQSDSKGNVIYKNQSLEERKVAAREQETQAASDSVPQTIFQEKFDRTAAESLAKYDAEGGYSKVKSNVIKLSRAIKMLKSGKDLTGGLLSLVPKEARDIISPERSDIEGDVRNVVQQTLKETLGGQFAEKEGERVINSVFNPRLGEVIIARRVELYRNQILEIAQAKQSMVDWVNGEGKGTLNGYSGQRPTDGYTMLDLIESETDDKGPIQKKAAPKVDDDILGIMDGLGY